MRGMNILRMLVAAILTPTIVGCGGGGTDENDVTTWSREAAPASAAVVVIDGPAVSLATAQRARVCLTVSVAAEAGRAITRSVLSLMQSPTDQAATAEGGRASLVLCQDIDLPSGDTQLRATLRVAAFLPGSDPDAAAGCLSSVAARSAWDVQWLKP